MEVSRALELGRPVIPVCLGSIELHGWYQEKLGGLQQIMHSDDASDDAWFGKLLNALRQQRRSQVQNAGGPGGRTVDRSTRS